MADEVKPVPDDGIPPTIKDLAICPGCGVLRDGVLLQREDIDYVILVCPPCAGSVAIT